jgi:NADPH-dependent 2,4-dienoyl-CoA reductase/sulfur reductase-like enzyme
VTAVAPQRLVVVGANAAGMSAASQALRTAAARGADLEVVAVEQGTDVSYSACGIPYWVAGDVADADALVARTAQQHRDNGIDLRLSHRATGLDLDRRELEVHDLDDRTTRRLGFDHLMIATGAAPIQPEWAAGIDGVLPVTSLTHGATWRALLDKAPRRALIVGGGYIGVEVAEAFARRGLRTTMVNRGGEPMSGSLEPELGKRVRAGLELAGVEVITGTEVEGLEAGRDGGIRAACIGGTAYEADVVALALGVRPRTALAADAGLPVGEHGGLVPDDRQRLGDGIWAAGDCCEVWDRLLGQRWFVPLGTHANKTGRVAGTNIGGGDACFPGIVGTAILRAADAEVGRTGLTQRWADGRGLATESVLMDSTTAAGYMPEADPVTVWVLGERGTGRLLGCQLVGGRGAGKRVDIAATALWAGLTAHDVAMSDLAYAPPFSPVWDPVQIACRRLAERL